MFVWEYLHRNNIILITYGHDHSDRNKSLGRVNDLRQVRCHSRGFQLSLYGRDEINLTDDCDCEGESGVASKEFEQLGKKTFRTMR